MKTPQKSMTEIAEKLAWEYRHEIPEHDLTITGTFKAGFSAREQLDETPLKIALAELQSISEAGCYNCSGCADVAIAKIKAMQVME